MSIQGLCFDAKGRGLAHPANRGQPCGCEGRGGAALCSRRLPGGASTALLPGRGVTLGGFRRVPGSGFAPSPFASRRGPAPGSGTVGPARPRPWRPGCASARRARLRSGSSGAGGAARSPRCPWGRARRLTPRRLSRRAAQYACAVAGDALRRNGASAGLLGSVRQLEAHLSLGRKREWGRPGAGGERGRGRGR